MGPLDHIKMVDPAWLGRGMIRTVSGCKEKVGNPCPKRRKKKQIAMRSRIETERRSLLFSSQVGRNLNQAHCFPNCYRPDQAGLCRPKAGLFLDPRECLVTPGGPNLAPSAPPPLETRDILALHNLKLA